GSVQYYPRGVCATCWSPDVAWTPSPGRGRVYTFTVTHRTQARGFRDDLPYVLAWIELEEGVQVMSNIVGVDPVKVAIGMPVKVTFEDVKDGLSIPKFTGRRFHETEHSTRGLARRVRVRARRVAAEAPGADERRAD